MKSQDLNREQVIRRAILTFLASDNVRAILTDVHCFVSDCALGHCPSCGFILLNAPVTRKEVKAQLSKLLSQGVLTCSKGSYNIA